MQSGKKDLALISLAYLALVSSMAIIPLDSAWGINQFRFLPQPTALLLAILFAVLFAVLLSTSEARLQQFAGRAHDFIFETAWRGPILTAFLSIVILYLFRAETHFLGDGYAWLSSFGGGEGYIPKWSELGSIQIVRMLQSLIGERAELSALVSFRIMSITSGGLAIMGGVMLIRELVHSKLARLVGLVLLLGGGQALLFFGYVEFYPLSWAGCIFLLYFTIQYARHGDGLPLIALLFLVGLLIHVQVIYFLPALFWLIIRRESGKKRRVIYYAILLSLCIKAAIGLIYLINNRVDIEILFMPFLHGRPSAPDYYFFSLPHLNDLLQQMLLIIPALPFLIWMSAGRWRKVRHDLTSQFLIAASLGSLSFLLLFGAVLTRARDWDIFSLCLLAPILFFVRLLDSESRDLPVRPFVAAGLVTVFMTTGFLAANLGVEASENRFYSTLNQTDSKDHSSWSSLATYYQRIGDTDRYNWIVREMNDLFPGYVKLKKAYALLEKGRPDQALPVALELAESDSYNREYLKLAGSAYSRLGKYDLAEPYYERAHRLGPYLSTLKNEIGQMYLAQQRYKEALGILKEAHCLSPEKTFIAEGLGLAYYRLDQYDSALAVADTLFHKDPNSPGAHLLSMVVAISSNRIERASYHYTEFLRYGAGRSDYTRIRESYAYLEQ
ncbi:MAG: tetratricopeptide repeat protein [bacterium]|nr:tetratricopeptide repeat protein [bacterium]